MSKKNKECVFPKIKMITTGSHMMLPSGVTSKSIDLASPRYQDYQMVFTDHGVLVEVKEKVTFLVPTTACLQIIFDDGSLQDIKDGKLV